MTEKYNHNIFFLELEQCLAHKRTSRLTKNEKSLVQVKRKFTGAFRLLKKSTLGAPDVTFRLRIRRHVKNKGKFSLKNSYNKYKNDAYNQPFFALGGGGHICSSCYVFAYICTNTRTGTLKKLFSIVSLEKGRTQISPPPL